MVETIWVSTGNQVFFACDCFSGYQYPMPKKLMTRRELLSAASGVTLLSAVAMPRGKTLSLVARAEPLNVVGGADRVVMRGGKTYLNAWAGYGDPPREGRGGRRAAAAPALSGTTATMLWTKVSGPGSVMFADPKAAVTTAVFSAPGDYVIQVTAENGEARASSPVGVKVALPPPPVQLMPVVTRRHTITSPLWSARCKALIVNWIPHVIEMCERIPGPNERSDGGIDNFIEAGKALRGAPTYGWTNGRV